MRAKHLSWIVGLAVLAAAPWTLATGVPPKAPPKEPARVEVSVFPEAARPGGETRVTVRLSPADGIKINRYPKIRLKVPGQEGLILSAEAAVGNKEPPPPDRIEGNYFKTVDPVELTLRVDPQAPAGQHKVQGQLSYFYCVAASGFCAPAKVPVSIPLTVR